MVAHALPKAKLGAGRAGKGHPSPPLPGQVAHPLLGLQRQIGNRATTAIIRRKLAVGPEAIDQARSGTGQLKGALTKDTLYRLRNVVADYQKTIDPEEARARLSVILGLCAAYTSRHGDDIDPNARRKLAAVSDIMEAAIVEADKVKAAARFTRDVYAKKESDTSPTRFAHTTGSQIEGVATGAKLLAGGKTSQSGQIKGADAEALALCKRYGLTEAEILSVRLYTAQDYYYINPATAFDRSRLDKNMKPPDKGEDAEADPDALPWDQERQQLLEEGGLIGSFAMTAMQKLPAKKGKTYRGERFDEDRWERAGLDVGATYSSPNLTSVSLDRGKALQYTGVGSKTAPHETIGILWEIEVTNGRDIQALSIYGKTEGEWLLLPGAKLAITAVVPQVLPEEQGGARVRTTSSYIIRARQVS